MELYVKLICPVCNHAYSTITVLTIPVEVNAQDLTDYDCPRCGNTITIGINASKEPQNG